MGLKARFGLVNSEAKVGCGFCKGFGGFGGICVGFCEEIIKNRISREKPELLSLEFLSN